MKCRPQFAITLMVALLSACAHSAAQGQASAREMDATPFAAEILALEARDRAAQPAAGGIVFVGSSTFRLWSTLTTDFPGQHVLNRGCGGSTLPQVNRVMPRMVLPYRPHLVVLYGGDNDLAAGRPPDDVLYVDAFTPMLRADGRPRPALFGRESLHMSRAGYALWREVIAPVIQ